MRMLPRTCLLLALAALAGPVAPAAPPVPTPCRMAAPPTFQATTTFRVRATRFGLGTSRTVRVTANVGGLAGTIDVELNRPVRPLFGVRRLAIRVRILDDAGHLVDTVEAELPAGVRAFRLPVTFPAPGRYRLALANDDLDASPASVSIRPGGEAHLDVVAGRPGNVAAMVQDVSVN